MNLQARAELWSLANLNDSRSDFMISRISLSVPVLPPKGATEDAESSLHVGAQRHDLFQQLRRDLVVQVGGVQNLNLSGQCSVMQLSILL